LCNGKTLAFQASAMSFVAYLYLANTFILFDN
jgi:hypothetical protein